ncbi:MAG: FAD-dependent thymidylate synthase, partial [Acidobacteriota bacterium]
MSEPQPSRVVFLPPLAPEKLAYALARYSRSADPVEDSLAWVDEHSEERFWETFYFDYGHASIADLGHVAACFEGLSELAAIEVLDEQLWDGQARSTRYQDFSTTGQVTPPELEGHALESAYRERVEEMVATYLEVHDAARGWLEKEHPRPDDMKKGPYRRNIAARAFDVARGFLPLAIPTSVGQVTSIRTLEKQISRLLASPLREVQELGEALTEGCRTETYGGGKPPAPTLARHARRDAFAVELRERAVELVNELAADVAEPPREERTGLVRRRSAPVELLTGLLYEASRLTWDSLADRVEDLGPERRGELIADLLGRRGPHDEMPRGARAGHLFVYEIVMDVGGFRDMHRHRRCHQHLQEYDLDAACSLPPLAEEIGLVDRCREEHAKSVALAREIATAFSPRV